MPHNIHFNINTNAISIFPSSKNTSFYLYNCIYQGKNDKNEKVKRKNGAEMEKIIKKIKYWEGRERNIQIKKENSEDPGYIFSFADCARLLFQIDLKK